MCESQLLEANNFKLFLYESLTLHYCVNALSMQANTSLG
jgi:hypothetical protein